MLLYQNFKKEHTIASSISLLSSNFEVVLDNTPHLKRCSNFISYFDIMDIDATNHTLKVNNDDHHLNNFIKEDEEQTEENKIHELFEKENTLFYQTPIILIDDNPDLLLAFNLFLKDEGYTNVKTFSDSKSLLKHLLDIDNLMYYKLAISDIKMPCINGIQLYQLLKILNPSIKIMFVTALDKANELTSIFSDIKSQDIIRKPVDRNRFVQMVNNKVRTM